MTAFRVLHLIDGFTVGGAESLLPILGAGLRDQGVEVTFAALFERPGSPLLARLEADGFSPHVLGVRGLRASALRHLQAFLRAQRPDVLHAHLTYASILGPLAAARQHIPSVVTLHQLGALDWRQSRAALRECAFRLAVGARAQRVVGVSAAVADYYARRGIPRSRLRVVYNAIDAAPFQAPLDDQRRSALRAELGLSSDARVLISVAMLRQGKGLGVLLRAMAAIRQRQPQAVLLIVGDGPERPRLTRLADDLELGGSVRFLGVRTDVPALLGLAQVFVLPTRYEALPTVLLEANAAGLPAVASDVGGVPELVRHNVEGLLTPVGDSPALATSICRLLEDGDLRARLAAAARVRAHDFSLRRWAQRLLDVYREAIGVDGASTHVAHGLRMHSAS